MKTLLVCFSVLLCVGYVNADILYFNDFESAVGTEWSNTTQETTPIGERGFLGQFSNDNVELTLSSLPSHEYLLISLDLFILKTWDGSQLFYSTNGNWHMDVIGPDYWLLSVNDDIVLQATFSNFAVFGFQQTFPIDEPGQKLARTGAVENNSLGFGSGGDSVYRISVVVPHAEDSLKLSLVGLCSQNLDDESWGIDNIQISSIPEPMTLSLMIFGTIGLIRRKK